MISWFPSNTFFLCHWACEEQPQPSVFACYHDILFLSSRGFWILQPPFTGPVWGVLPEHSLQHSWQPVGRPGAKVWIQQWWKKQKTTVNNEALKTYCISPSSAWGWHDMIMHRKQGKTQMRKLQKTQVNIDESGSTRLALGHRVSKSSKTPTCHVSMICKMQLAISSCRQAVGMFIVANLGVVMGCKCILINHPTSLPLHVMIHVGSVLSTSSYRIGFPGVDILVSRVPQTGKRGNISGNSWWWTAIYGNLYIKLVGFIHVFYDMIIPFPSTMTIFPCSDLLGRQLCCMQHCAASLNIWCASQIATVAAGKNPVWCQHRPTLSNATSFHIFQEMTSMATSSPKTSLYAAQHCYHHPCKGKRPISFASLDAG